MVQVDKKNLKVSKILKTKLEDGNLTDVTVNSAKTLCEDIRLLGDDMGRLQRRVKYVQS